MKWRKVTPGVGCGWAGIERDWIELSCAAVRWLLRLDDLLVAWLNQAARRWPAARHGATFAARWCATAEVGLMLALGAQGRVGTVLRMLLAVTTVYAASEALGRAWQRERPFSRLPIEGLLQHQPERSFPSRHVASALAMASIGGRSSRGVGAAMTVLAWLLAVSRVAAGLHFPSDILAGALLGRLVGWLFRT